MLHCCGPSSTNEPPELSTHCLASPSPVAAAPNEACSTGPAIYVLTGLYNEDQRAPGSRCESCRELWA